jgi:hypothetical protein
MPIINIGSKLDAKGFKQADTAISKLTKSTKGLGRTLGLTFGATAILAYGKAAVKAAANDEAAQASLAQTLKNLGYESVGTAQSLNTFISTMEKQTGILDDDLRPAMDRLLRATGSVTKSQELMSLALDISAGTGKDLGQVSQSLQKAYLGQTQALGRLGVGLSKAELASSNFEEITARLTTLFEGQASRQADSYKGSIDKLAVASNNVAEAIGIGIIDALKLLSEDGSIDSVTVKMENFGTKIGEAIAGTASLLAKFQKFTSIKKGEGLFINGQEFKLVESTLDQLAAAGREATGKKIFGGIYATKYQLEANAAAEKLAVEYAKKQALLAKQKLATEQKALQAKKLAAAIDKANLALNKSKDVFDLDSIQVAAALVNQAEQLGKATTSSQVLAIANDVARLNVKQSILALEDAIASKDEAAIVAATNKLNADLKILGTLSQQNVKLLDIKSILDTLVPKDLINLANLNEALRLLGLINLASTGSKTTPAAITPATPAPSVVGLKPATTIAETNANVASLGGIISTIGSNLLETTILPAVRTIIQPNGREFSSSYMPNITIQTGIGDPNAIAEAVTQVIQDAVDRGTLRGGAY